MGDARALRFEGINKILYLPDYYAEVEDILDYYSETPEEVRRAFEEAIDYAVDWEDTFGLEPYVYAHVLPGEIRFYKYNTPELYEEFLEEYGDLLDERGLTAEFTGEYVVVQKK